MSVETFVPPTIPSKWDIIPIHNSDRGSFKRCRRYWNWNSPARMNLNLRADVHGVNTDLWFGTGIHWALEQYYNPVLSRDPVEAWKTWFDIQWRGGIVTEDWLSRVYDLKPRPVVDINPASWDKEFPPTWQVRGLNDIIPSPDHEKFDMLYVLGVEMMQYYKESAAKHDTFTVLAVEHDFSVPIWDYENDCILKMRDTREESPNYGQMLEVHARGRMDNLALSQQEKLNILDYKTAAKIDEDYFEKLDTDEQCTSYLWAAEVEAEYYDLPHKGVPVEEVIYVALRKAYPKPPTMLKSGFFSVNRQEESTTIEMLDQFIDKFMGFMGPDDTLVRIPLDEKQQAYYNYVRDSGEEQFIIRRPVRRNRHQIANAGKRIYLEALDMLNNPIIYPNISNDWRCLRCQFRAPCIASEDGSDVDMLIEQNYVSAKDR